MPERRVTPDDIADDVRKLVQRTRLVVQRGGFINPSSIVGDSSGSSIISTTTGMKNPMDATGQLIRGGSSGSPAKLSHPGIAGKVLTTTSSNVQWGDPVVSTAPINVGLTAMLDGGGSVITNAQTVYVKVPFSCTVKAEVVADVVGSIVVSISRAPTATPATFTAISASSNPTLITQQTNKDTSIAGDWTDVTLDLGDWLRFAVVGTPTSVKLVAIALDLERVL